MNVEKENLTPVHHFYTIKGKMHTNLGNDFFFKQFESNYM